MRPDALSVLSAIVLGMDEELAAMVPGPAKFRLGTTKTLLSVICRDLDDAAKVRVEEISGLSALLRRGASLVPEPLQARLLAAAARADSGSGDLRVSALEQTLDMLLAVVDELQIWLETAASDDAKILLRDTWAFLFVNTQRQIVKPRPF